MLIRRGAAVALILMLCSSLTGCWSRPLETNFFARSTSEGIELLFCRSVEVTDLSITRVNDTTKDDLHWEGAISWRSGDGDALELKKIAGLPAGIGGMPLQSGERLSFSIEYRSGPGDPVSSIGAIRPPDTLGWPQGSWIGTDGKIHNSPCGA